MLDRQFFEEFSLLDDTIHKLAVTLLLSKYESERLFTQNKFAYRVKGGKSGHLYYKRRNSDKWVLIANWCFYGLYIVVRYRKPIWLRSMYRHLFARMNFVSIAFHDYSIELVDSEGETLRSRRFRLSPPLAFEKVMSENFGYSKEEINSLRRKVGLN